MRIKKTAKGEKGKALLSSWHTYLYHRNHDAMRLFFQKEQMAPVSPLMKWK